MTDPIYEAATFLFADGGTASVWWMHDRGDAPPAIKRDRLQYRAELMPIMATPEQVEAAEARIVDALASLLEGAQRP